VSLLFSKINHYLKVPTIKIFVSPGTDICTRVWAILQDKISFFFSFIPGVYCMELIPYETFYLEAFFSSYLT
jgi:hypothetical protein